jgi:endoglucanase
MGIGRVGLRLRQVPVAALLFVALVVGGRAQASGTAPLAVRVDGARLVDASGQTLQLRGVNVSGMQDGPIHGAAHPWDFSNLTNGSGGQPDWQRIRQWNLNAVRLPLSEASWLGLTTTDIDGTKRKADPSGDYQATVIKSVRDALAAGLYVILDLHSSAPAQFSANAQNPFMDADHSLVFWSRIATTFKNEPGVIFEPFNEPFLRTTSNGDGAFTEQQDWNKALRDGGIEAKYYFGSANGKPQREVYTWTIIGYQAAVDTIRSVGAKNVIILGGQMYDNDDTWWMQYPPSDPLKQLAMSYHAYPTNWGYELTGASRQHSAAQGIVMLTAPGVPVIITEFGGPVGPGADTGFASSLLKLADQHGWGVMAWTWNPWNGANRGENTLIQDVRSYAPTIGFGTVYRDWALGHH